jgi:hypothetical protein
MEVCERYAHPAREHDLMPALVFKAVKPKRLQDQILKNWFRGNMMTAVREIRADFEQTTRTWKHRPEFVAEMDLEGPGPTVMVGTDDEIYRYVDEGTKPHIIRPVHGKRLVFQGGYSAKTAPHVIGSQEGGAFGDRVFATEVHHPGNEAREFTKDIQKRWQPRFKARMEDAMRKAAQESGHGV